MFINKNEVYLRTNKLILRNFQCVSLAKNRVGSGSPDFLQVRGLAYVYKAPAVMICFAGPLLFTHVHAAENRVRAAAAAAAGPLAGCGAVRVMLVRDVCVRCLCRCPRKD